MKKVNNHYMPKPLAWLMALLLAALVAGCGGNGIGFGTLGVSLTDEPACGLDAVNVTVTKVRVHQSDSASENSGGWIDITLNPARKINLLSLNNGVLENLGQTPLTVGHYSQLRLVLDPNTGGSLANSVIPTGGVETSLFTPSALQSGIKLINQFDVAPGQRVDLVLDFNACKSIVANGHGNYVLKPVIKVIPFEMNGINGFVDPALLTDNVLVTAQQNGVVVQTTVPNATTGEFLLSRVTPGDYDVALTANGHATAVIAAVPVATTTSVVNVSTSGTPITLPVSATHIISGTITLNPSDPNIAAYATAKQVIGALPIVTVKSQAADLATDAYSLTLPTDPPRFAQYSTTLPLVFADGTFIVGQYTDEASATGYVTQPFVANISTADVAHDFTLIP